MLDFITFIILFIVLLICGLLLNHKSNNLHDTETVHYTKQDKLIFKRFSIVCFILSFISVFGCIGIVTEFIINIF